MQTMIKVGYIAAEHYDEIAEWVQEVLKTLIG